MSTWWTWTERKRRGRKGRNDEMRKNDENDMQETDVHAEIVGRHARMQLGGLKKMLSNKGFLENSVFTQRVS